MKRLFAGLAALSLIAAATSVAAQTQPPLRPNALAVDAGTKTATAASGAATLNKNAGVVTTESLSTAAGGVYTLTLTDSAVAATDTVFATVSYGSATTGLPEIALVTPSAGSATIVIHNDHASAAFNGSLKIGFLTLKY